MRLIRRLGRLERWFTVKIQKRSTQNMTPINKSYINRCPFCVSKDIKVVLDRQWPGRMLMGICTNCRCCGGHGKTSKKTLNSWNKYSEWVWSAHRETMKRHYAGWSIRMFKIHSCFNCGYSWFRGCNVYCHNPNRYSKKRHPSCTEYEMLRGCEEWIQGNKVQE